MTSELIHHYTDINALALILKNKTIRFTRLDKVDDITESSTFETLKLDKFFFVSCWTCDQNESIPQWNMYAKNMAGVRISLPIRMFNYKPLVIPNYKGVIPGGEYLSPIPFERLFGDDYSVLPSFQVDSSFGMKVIYIDDVVKKKCDAIKYSKKRTGNAIEYEISIKDFPQIAAFKYPDWLFQKEFRFILFITPSIKISKNDENFFYKYNKEYIGFIAKCIDEGIGPNFEYFDVDLDPTIAESMKIMVGPDHTPGDFIVVESLMNRYAPLGILEKSKFPPRRK